MRDLTREQCFCQWVISKILALYMTQEDFRNEVDSKVNDGYSFSIGGEKMSEYEQAEWKLNMVCVDIAKQFTEYYFKDFWGDEFEADRKTEPTISKMEQVDEPMKTTDYCDICKRDMCEYCIADATNPYCVPSHYEINYEPKDEPKTQTETQNSNSTFEKADEPQTDCPWK